MSQIEEIKERLDIVDIVSETVQLKRAGKNLTGFCPFHANTRTPSFVVFPETGTWRCFGQCSEGGDIYKFVMKREGWDFPEALRNLAERAGVQLRKLTPQEENQNEEYDRLRGLLEDAAAFYRHHLFNHPAGENALEYLHERGLTDETLEIFEVGYAPPGWENGLKHFIEKGYSEEDLMEAGVISQRDKGGYYDRFRNRIMIPIRDARGRMAGFGARAVDPNDEPKYLNSPQTPLFDKSRILYGLDKARKEIRAKDQVVIVEGYLDVIAPYQAGFKNLVSPMGTALTEHQLRILKRFSRRIVMALDADAAGAKATLRGLQVARDTMDREFDMRFDARGLLQQEGRLQADIRVTTLPEGMDPDNVVNQDPDAWPSLIEAAKPVVTHVMETLASERDLNDPKVKTDIAAQVMPLIQDISSAIERDTYTQALARLLKLDERTLLADYKPARRKKPNRGKSQPARPRRSDKSVEVLSAGASVLQPIQRLEAHCLGIVMRHPELLYRVDRVLQEAGLLRITPEDFQLTNHQEMFKVSKNSLGQDFLEPMNYALDNLPLPLVEMAEDILEKSVDYKLTDDRVFEDLVRGIVNIRRRNLRQHNDQLRFLQEEAQEQGDLQARQYTEIMVKNAILLDIFDKALGTKLTGYMAAS